MRLGLAERGLVSEPPGDRRVGPGGLLADEREVAVVLDLLSLELGQDCGRPAPLGGQQTDEDLLAQRRRPGRPPGEPGTERSLATRGQAKDAPRARACALVTPHHEPAPLELVQELVDLADVGMPEGPDAPVEALQELAAVCLTLGEQRQQRVPEVHLPPSLREVRSEPRARREAAPTPRASTPGRYGGAASSGTAQVSSSTMFRA